MYLTCKRERCNQQGMWLNLDHEPTAFGSLGHREQERYHHSLMSPSDRVQGRRPLESEKVPLTDLLDFYIFEKHFGNSQRTISSPSPITKKSINGANGSGLKTAGPPQKLTVHLLACLLSARESWPVEACSKYWCKLIPD